MVARRAHNPKVVGSNPASATKAKSLTLTCQGLLYSSVFYETDEPDDLKYTKNIDKQPHKKYNYIRAGTFFHK